MMPVDQTENKQKQINLVLAVYIYYRNKSLLLPYSFMAYRQKNIPATSKEEAEVQTDVRLLEPNLMDRQQQHQQQHEPHAQVRLSHFYNTSGLLRPFSDQQLLRQFSKTLQELKNAQPTDNVFGKRLELLQNQINGLLKRDFLINGVAEGSQKLNSYYLTLNQKQKTIIRLQNQKLHSNAQIQRLRHQIESLQKEVTHLLSSLVNSQKAVDENQLYSSFYEKINHTLTKSKNKGIQLQTIMQELILPITTEFTFNLAAINRNVNRSVDQSIKSVVLNLAHEFDCLLKQSQFTQQKLSETIIGLIYNFKAVKGIDYLKDQFQLALKTQVSEENYKNMLFLFKHEIQLLKKEGKGVQRFDSLVRRLETKGIQLFDCKGWIHLISPEIKIIETNTEDRKLKELIGVLAGQFKRVYLKFPQLKNHVSSKLVDIFQSQVLVELIEGGSIEKLKEIVIHDIDTVRVDNVYQYQNSNNQKTIFHLRVLIKRLLQELENVKKNHKIDLVLDEGILAILREHIIDGFNTEDYISLFRPIPKILEVPIMIETPIYETKTFERAIQINTEKQIILREQKMNVITLNREVPVYIQKAVEHITHKNIPITVQTQKVVPVEVIRDTLVERIVQSTVEVPVLREKSVSLYEREEVVRQIEIEKIVEKVELKEIQKVIQTGRRQYLQVERIVQKPIYLYQTRQQIKQVQVRVPHIIKQTEYLQIQKNVPYIIQRKQIVNIERGIPIEIRVPQINIVETIEYRDKPIVVKQYKEVVKQIPITKEKQLLRETAKQIFIQRSHFIKADQVEVIREIEVYVDKPLIHQIFTTKDTQIEKIVPLYITEQVPVIHEVSVPYVSQTIRQLAVQKIKLVPVKEEIIKPIHIEKPVPVVVQKQTVKVQTQIVQRIVQKIVQVPRVVQIEKIVEKIVVVPRIVQRIVQVPTIIEKIVVLQQHILQIVQIPVPYVVIQEVQRPVQVIVEKIVVQIQKQIQIVQIQRIVERIIERDRYVQVQVEKRIPYQVIRQIAVPTYRDRIEYKKMQIRQTKVETIEVQVPFLFQQLVPFYVDKHIVTEHIIEQPVYQKIYIEKEKPIIKEVERLVVREVVVQRPIITEVVKQIPGPETIQYIYEPKIVEIIKQKIVQLHNRIEIPKQVYLVQEKIVHEIHQKIVQVPVNTIVVAPQLIQVPKLIHLTHYKQIAVDVPVREERVRRDLLEQIKTVEVIKQVPVEVQIYREKVKEIISEVRQYITSEIVKEIHSDVEIRSPVQYQLIEVPGKTIVQQLHNTFKTVQTQDKIIERVIQKIVMLPQIVEFVKHIHHIAEVNSLGVAVDVDINVQTQKYKGVNEELRKSLLQLLSNLRYKPGHQPNLKYIIGIIQKHIKIIDDWIAFPKLIEIKKEVVKEVEKERIVLVPTPDKQKQAILSYMLEKLLNELKRIKQSHKIPLQLDHELLKIFFTAQKIQGALDHKLAELSASLKIRISSFGSWSQSNPFLINAFLQDHFCLRSLIEESNKVQQEQVNQINGLRHEVDIATNKYENMLCYNRKMFADNSALIQILQKHRSSIADEQINRIIQDHRQFYDQLVAQKHSFLTSSIKNIHKHHQLVIQEYSPTEGANKSNIVDQLIGKLNQQENTNKKLLMQTMIYQNELSKSKEELSIRNNIIKRLEYDSELKLQKSKEQVSKNPSLNKDLAQQIKKLQQQNQTLQRSAITEKLAADRNKKEFERVVQNQKKDYESKLDKKDKEIKDAVQKIKRQSQKQLNRIKQDMQRFKTDRDKFQAELIQTRAKAAQQNKKLLQYQSNPSSDKYNQLINKNLALQKRSESLQQEFQKLKQAASENNSINDKELSRLRKQNQKLINDQRQWEKRKKQGILDIPQESQKRNIELTKKVEYLEADLRRKDQTSSTQLQVLREKVKKLEIQLQDYKKQIEMVQKSRLESTKFGLSGYKPTTSIFQLGQSSESKTRTPISAIKKTLEQDSKSPEISKSRGETIGQFISPQSRKSQQSSEEAQMTFYYKQKMSLREFIDAKPADDSHRQMYITFLMIKIIEKIEMQVQGGRYNSYSPNNIFLLNFDVKNLEQMGVKFGYPINNKNFKNEGLYLSPQILAGGASSKRSTVFCLGVILDELIHGSNFFKSIDQIQDLQIEFRVRAEKLNPILKNTLFEMMSKDPSKRLELMEAKRRLSLQKYITKQTRGSATSSSRLGRG